MLEHFVDCANQPYAFRAELITNVHENKLNLVTALCVMWRKKKY